MNTHSSLSPPSGTFWSAPDFDVKVSSGKVGPIQLRARETIFLPPPRDGTNFPCALLDPAVPSFVWHSSSCLLETGFILLPSVVFWSLSPHMVLLQGQVSKDNLENNIYSVLQFVSKGLIAAILAKG